MSDDFICPVVYVTIEPHPNADKVEVARCNNGNVSVVGKGMFKTGDLVVCIPQHAIVPEDILAEIGLEGKLRGKKKNIVGPVKLRDVYSDCILYPLTGKRFEGRMAQMPAGGTDMAEVLGIKKRVTDHPMIYEGVVTNPRNIDKITYGNYDIENLYRWEKKVGDRVESIFNGQDVYITEKIHGTWVEFSYHPQAPEVVTSKGYSKKELIFKLDDHNKNNLYVNKFKQHKGQIDLLFKLIREDFGVDMDTPIRLMGEIYGPKVQDLHYGEQLPKFIAFDIYIGKTREGRFLPPDQFFFMCKKADIETVPLLYKGKYEFDSEEDRMSFLEFYGTGPSILDADTMREGCVIKTAEEQWDDRYGRVVAKYISERYMNRPDGTEYN